MASYYPRDIVEFVQDPAIDGMIVSTCTDVEFLSKFGRVIPGTYIHPSTSAKDQEAWRSQRLIARGYVLVKFLDVFSQSGYCYVAETSLRLRDRGLTLHAIVKRKPSDAQSGRVLSLSTRCTLSPVCLSHNYASAHPILNRGNWSGNKPWSTLPHALEADTHGVFDDNQGNSTVPAGELKSFHDYQFGDQLFYKGWFGVVKSYREEITVRLTNGVTFIVEDHMQLKAPSYILGTPSHELAFRLARVGYFYESDDSGLFSKVGTDNFYPGLHVSTKRGNLRPFHPSLVTYHENQEIQGIIVAVQAIKLRVKWLYRNFLDSNHRRARAPPCKLGTDVLYSGEIQTLTRRSMLLRTLAKTIANANYDCMVKYGTQVRFRDPRSAMIKYPNYRRIPRIETQHYDMNVLYVISTYTKAFIKWQDGTTSEEISSSLIPISDMSMSNVCLGVSDKIDIDAWLSDVENASTKDKSYRSSNVSSEPIAIDIDLEGDQNKDSSRGEETWRSDGRKEEAGSPSCPPSFVGGKVGNETFLDG